MNVYSTLLPSFRTQAPVATRLAGNPPMPPLPVLKTTLQWMEGNGLPLPSPETLAASQASLLSQQQGQSHAVLEALRVQLNLPSNHPQWQALQQQVERQLLGNTPKAKWLKHLLAFEYVPSALVMLWVTQSAYNQLEKGGKLTRRDNRLLMHQEYVRQAMGFAIQFVQAYASFGVIGGLMSLMKKHPQLRAWGQARNGRLGQQAQQLADALQRGWNTLYRGDNQTWAAVGLALGMNVLNYGLLRPLLMVSAIDSTLELDPLPRKGNEENRVR